MAAQIPCLQAHSFYNGHAIKAKNQQHVWENRGNSVWVSVMESISAPMPFLYSSYLFRACVAVIKSNYAWISFQKVTQAEPDTGLSRLHPALLQA